MTEHGFTRTTCDCPECVACCHRQPGPLAPGDLERIVEYLQVPDAATTLFVASPGALVGNLLTGTRFRVGTITPRREGDRCVFLSAGDRCTIHEVAPFGCAYFDTHMDVVEGHRRAVWLTHQQMTDAYQLQRTTLPPAQKKGQDQ